MPEIEAVKQERERERVTCVEKCLQLCGDVAPLAFNLTTAVLQVSPKSVKIAVHLKILNASDYLFIIN